MDLLRWDDRPQLRRPVLVAAFEGWADAADAASDAVSWLASTWDARPFAGIDPEEFFDFTSTRPTVRLDEDLNRHVEWPRNVFSACSAPGSAHDVVLLQGVEPHLKWRTFAGLITEVCETVGVEMMLSLGALLAEVPHTREVRITGTSADAATIDRLGMIRSRYQGPTGILSVVTEALGARGIPSASLWAATPHYVSQTPSPKATLALVQRAGDILGASVRATDLEVASAAYERQVSEVVAGDEDVAAYVRRLEQAHEQPQLELRLPDAEALADEVEKFLREQSD